MTPSAASAGWMCRLNALPSPQVDRYRNKVQFPVGRDKNGAPCIGFYAGRTHRIVPCPDCKLQPGVLNDIGNALCAARPTTSSPTMRPARAVRHVFLRRSCPQRADHGLYRLHPPEAPPQRGAGRPAASAVPGHRDHPRERQRQKHQRHPRRRDPHPFRPRLHRGHPLRRPVRLGPLSFYQVNTLAAEQLAASPPTTLTPAGGPPA